MASMPPSSSRSDTHTSPVAAYSFPHNHGHGQQGAPSGQPMAPAAAHQAPATYYHDGHVHDRNPHDIPAHMQAPTGSSMPLHPIQAMQHIQQTPYQPHPAHSHYHPHPHQQQQQQQQRQSHESYNGHYLQAQPDLHQAPHHGSDPHTMDTRAFPAIGSAHQADYQPPSTAHQHHGPSHSVPHARAPTPTLSVGHPPDTPASVHTPPSDAHSTSIGAPVDDQQPAPPRKTMPAPQPAHPPPQPANRAPPSSALPSATPFRLPSQLVEPRSNAMRPNTPDMDQSRYKRKYASLKKQHHSVEQQIRKMEKALAKTKLKVARSKFERRLLLQML
ncbi:hypothetical protein BC831DRAFT_428818, partial [Entophlyctis helioformis]